MGTLDIIILICFIPAFVRGIQKGFVEQIVGIISIVLGAWLASMFSRPLGEWLTQFINLDAQLLQILSFILVVILAILLLHLAGRLITGTLKMVSLGWLNRLLGVVFALLKAALVTGLVIFIFGNLNDRWHLVNPEILQASEVYTALRDAAMKVFPYLQTLIQNVQ